ncbi:MAG TPA: cysteine desulfurase [Flavobacteriales bacterium]|nr:cysteine desulfurase [Flavobacteriales bacterium]
MEALEVIDPKISAIRKQFPILEQKVNGKPLIYFDNGATTQKPLQVIHSIVDYYSSYNSNIHRGVHTLSQTATARYDKARVIVGSFINAGTSNSVIFTKGTTDSINFVANAYGNKFVHEGDEILVTAMEHHSNILPWQELCKRKKALLKVLPVDENGVLKYDELDSLLTAKTKLFAFTHVSNTLGTVNDVQRLTEAAHAKNIPVLIDGAQAVPHLMVDLGLIDADFYVFSGHKMYGPTGIGVLYAKEKWLNQFNVYQTGGGTIKSVTFEQTEYSEGPHKFEAGTPNIEGAIALAEAVKFMEDFGIANLARYEHELMEYATKRLDEIEGIKLIGTAPCKAGVISFNVGKIHPFDIGTLLDKQGIAVRTGHHCTQPLMQCYNIQGTVRMSFAVYNTKQEIDVFIEALKKAVKMLS